MKDYRALLSIDSITSSSNTFAVYLLIYFHVPTCRRCCEASTKSQRQKIFFFAKKFESRLLGTFLQQETKEETSLIMIKIINIPFSYCPIWSSRKSYKYFVLFEPWSERCTARPSAFYLLICVLISLHFNLSRKVRKEIWENVPTKVKF